MEGNKILSSSMSSSSFSPSFRRSTSCGIEEESRVCYCGMRSFLQVAKTESNYGRRFFSCPNYKRGKKCKFFVWKDQQFGDQAEVVIRELCFEKERLLKKLEMMKMTEDESFGFEEDDDNWSRSEGAIGMQKNAVQLNIGKLKEMKKKLKIREEKLQCFEEKLREREEKLKGREEIVMKREGKCVKFFVIALLLVGLFMVLVLNV